MSYQLITEWGDYRLAIPRLLALARESLDIFDTDLRLFQFEKAQYLDLLEALLTSRREDPPNLRIRVVLRDTQQLNYAPARLRKLLEIYEHLFVIIKLSERLQHLPDSMLIADQHSALICFQHGLARSKLLCDEPVAIAPYLNRFAEIWAEGGERFTPNAPGL